MPATDSPTDERGADVGMIHDRGAGVRVKVDGRWEWMYVDDGVVDLSPNEHLAAELLDPLFAPMLVGELERQRHQRGESRVQDYTVICH